MRRWRIADLREVCRRFGPDRGANFAVMTALSVPFAVALTAFAVDEGSLFTERREMQALVDLAAITAANNIDNVEAAVLATFKDNGLSSVVVKKIGDGTAMPAGKAVVDIVQGRYTASSSVGVHNRFEAGKQPFNAVEVSLRKTGTLYFGGAIISPPVIGTSAIASTTAQAMFSVGSRLLKVEGGILNAVLSGLLGGNISLSVMDYNALISADVDMLSFVDGLAVQLHMTGVTYSEVLASKATIGQIATAMADVPGLDHASKLALRTIAGTATSTVKIPLSRLLDLGSVGQLGLGQRPAGLSVDASALGMLSAAGALANGSHQVELNLGATIPGLTATTLAIAIGEPAQFSPWLAVGEAGTVVRTAQTRIKLVATVGVGNSSLGGGVKLLSVRLPLNVEVAYAEAKLTDIDCPTGRPDSVRVSIAAHPGIVALRIADSDGAGFADFAKPQSFHDAGIADISIKLLLLTLDLVSINGSASVAITDATPTTLTFDATDIAGKKIKTVSTRNLTQSLTTSLIDDLSLSIEALGIGLNLTAVLATVKPAVVTVLNGVTEPVDTLVFNVLGALGIGVGQADVRVTGATCGRSVLVQ